MARKGGNPKIAEHGKNTRFGGERGYNAVKAAEKSNEIQAQERKLLDSVKQAIAEHPELIDKGALTLLKMAASGNVRVWELLIRWFGEDPANKLDISGGVEYVLKWGEDPNG